MEKVVPFSVLMKMKTPFCMDYPVTLDALLSVAVYNATGLTEDATIPHIPLIQEQGIFKASSLFCAKTFKNTTIPRVMALRHQNDFAAGLFKPTARGKAKQGQYTYIDQQRGKFKANLDSYYAIEASEVYFWGVGDPKQTEYMLQTFIQGIGKRYNGGAGEIDSVTVLTEAEDFSWKTEKQTPARPLPVAIWESIGGAADAPKQEMAVNLPYWKTPKVEAVFPVKWAM